MDEEEELENTLIGQQQEEEAPAVNTADIIMGARVPASAFGQAPAVNPFSMEAAGQVNPMMQQQSLEALVQPQVTFRDYSVLELPRASALSVFTPSGDLKPDIDVNAITTAPTTLSEPINVNITNPVVQPLAETQVPATASQFLTPNPLVLPSETIGQVPSVNPFSLESAEQVNPIMRAQELGSATQGQGATQEQEETAPRSGLTTVGGASLSEFLSGQAMPEQGFVREERRLGGRGVTLSPEQMNELSAEREARLAARIPGDQTAVDTRAAQSRTTGGQTEGLSFDDARRRAEGQLAARGVRNPSASQVNALARGIQAAEPERLAELATQRAKDDIIIGRGQAASADEDSFNTSISNSTSAGGVIDYNKALNEYVGGGGSNRGYLEFLRKGQELEQEARDAKIKPEIKVVRIGEFNVLTQDGKYMTATTIGGEEVSTSAIRTIKGKIQLIEDAEKDYFSGDPERIRRAERTITALDIKDNEFGGQSTAKDYFEPDAGPKAFNPNTLSAEDKQFYDRLIGNDKQAFEYTKQFPNSAQTQVILKYLEQTYPDVD